MSTTLEKMYFCSLEGVHLSFNSGTSSWKTSGPERTYTYLPITYLHTSPAFHLTVFPLLLALRFATSSEVYLDLPAILRIYFLRSISWLSCLKYAILNSFPSYHSPHWFFYIIKIYSHWVCRFVSFLTFFMALTLECYFQRGWDHVWISWLHTSILHSA